MLKLVGSSTSATQLVANLDGKYNFSHLIYVGRWTADASAAGVLNDLGSLLYYKRDDVIINSTLSFLKYYGDMHGGINTYFRGTNSTNDGRACIVIPRGLADGNIDYVTPEDNARVEVNYGSGFNSVEYVSPEGRIFCWQQSGTNLYDLSFIRQVLPISSGGAGTIKISQDNLHEVFFTDSQTAIEALLIGTSGIAGSVGSYPQLQFRIGETQSNGRVVDYIDFTNAQYSVVSGNATAVNVYGPGNEATAVTRYTQAAACYSALWGGVGDSLNDYAEVEVSATTAAAQLCVLGVGARAAKTNKEASRMELNRKIAAQISNAQRSGKTSKLSLMAESGMSIG
jgi:hypothetical protein